MVFTDKTFAQRFPAGALELLALIAATRMPSFAPENESCCAFGV
jgi:hypothetical protein